VTGASGFVGRRLVAALEADGWAVVGTSVSAAGSFQRLDVTDRSAVHALFQSLPPVDAVVHLAAIAHPRGRRVSSAEFDRVNRLGVHHVLDEAAGAGIARVVFFSSSVVYGDDPGRDVSEDAARHPVGPYASSKRDAEDRCFAAIAGGQDVVVFRFPVIYGEEFLADVRARAYLPFTGNRVLLRAAGRQPAFSLCHVENAVGAVRHALRGGLPSGVYNVADTRPYSQIELRETIASIDGTRRALPVPVAPAAWALRACSSVLPPLARDALRAKAAKLFVGSTLDTARIRQSGYHPRRTLDHLRTQARDIATASSC
jgi:UDP-glucose 4-epimerase